MINTLTIDPKTGIEYVSGGNHDRVTYTPKPKPTLTPPPPPPKTTPPPPPPPPKSTDTSDSNTNTVTQDTPSCPEVDRVVSLGPSTIADNGMRVVASFSPCHLLDGKVILNLPITGIHLVAANIVTGQPIDAIAVDKQLVNNFGNGQAHGTMWIWMKLCLAPLQTKESKLP